MTIEFCKRRYRVKQSSRETTLVLYEKQPSGEYKEIHREDNKQRLSCGDLYHRGIELIVRKESK